MKKFEKKSVLKVFLAVLVFVMLRNLKLMEMVILNRL